MKICNQTNEALALCESDPRFAPGYSTSLRCPNLLGSYWWVDCCDFDPGYIFFCNHIPCN